MAFCIIINYWKWLKTPSDWFSSQTHSLIVWINETVCLKSCFAAKNILSITACSSNRCVHLFATLKNISPAASFFPCFGRIYFANLLFFPNSNPEKWSNFRLSSSSLPEQNYNMLKTWTNLNFTNFSERAKSMIVIRKNQWVISISHIKKYSFLDNIFTSYHLIWDIEVG